MHRLAILSSLVGAALAQKAGKETAETHPKMSWKKCSSGGSCQTVQGEVVIDANWRWLHNADGYDNCYDGNEWIDEFCASASECTSNCLLEGADYSKTYGVSTSGNALTLSFVTKHEYGTNIGSRMYLMEGASKYQMFTLMDNEFTFDVDLADLDCGLNGALYFVMMDADGGTSRNPENTAGAKYGTGYCDAQCARDLKFVGGKANSEGWKPSDNDANAGVGMMGGCCAEMDVWESNAHAFALTPHPCENNEYHVCTDSGCGGTYSEERFNGDCDPNGCDFNPYRMGNPDFYGKGLTVDTNSLITVVTQFQENKISQFYVQDGVKHEMPEAQFDGVTGNAVTPEFCKNQFQVFDDRDRFNEVGGFDKMNDALRSPWVLVMSMWDDHYANMLWLDSSYPPEKAGQPGGDRGPCPQDSGSPSDVESSLASAKVTYSNIRFGPIGSTVQV